VVELSSPAGAALPASLALNSSLDSDAWTSPLAVGRSVCRERMPALTNTQQASCQGRGVFECPQCGSENRQQPDANDCPASTHA
jgi:hypothetical protein